MLRISVMTCQSMSKVTKAVIPTAGLGTRFLPATKSVPKELLPIVDRPTLLYIIDECIEAGIEDVVLVTGRGKYAIEDFFDRSYELEDKLEKSGKMDLLEDVLRIRGKINLISIRQGDPKGLGHAVYGARPVVGAQPFAVLLGDELMVGTPGTTRELTNLFSETQKSTVAVMEVEASEVTKYGIADVVERPTSRGSLIRTFDVKGLVEKPKISKAPSRWALPGRYVFSPVIFDHLANTAPGVGGEIQLTDAMQKLALDSHLLASTFSCRRYDAGDKLGFIQANVELALAHPVLAEPFKDYLFKLVSQLEARGNS